MTLNYIPQPVDLSDVSLPDEISHLTEQIARNVHEQWAQSRLAEGWVYGEQVDDAKKTHPCLIPYDELPESEKDYDRNTSINTLKLILKMGFKIGK